MQSVLRKLWFLCLAAVLVTPAQAGSLSGEGMLSAPKHPVSTPIEKKIFIGDSRTVDLMNISQDDSIWACKDSMGYQWMVDEGIPAVEDEIEENSAVIIWLGVNDVHNIASYVEYVNQKAAEWKALGARTYYVSVGPVEADPYVTNTEIEAFNTYLQNNLIDVGYIDIYTYLLENGYATLDGTHYTDDVSSTIYHYIMDHLDESRTGLWG